MATEVYLGEPPAYVKEWIKNHKQNQFNFLYKKEVDVKWQVYEPSANDIQVVNEKVTITATGFKQIDGFANVREVILPNKWKNGSEVVDVTSIGDEAFMSRNGLKSVMIRDSVTSIGFQVFDSCSGITSVTFSGKDRATVKGMSNHYWGLPLGCVIHCTDGNITLS